MKPAKTRSSPPKLQLPPDNRKLPYMTGKDLLESGLIGMWKGRKDIRSSAAFARRLRKRVSGRAVS